ncbi:MAG: hypothetical protein EA401_12150 [Planctomycetota bacterium]|nr:MAG: hypothetical protein EA401_12150 [Planctomycetota bacterium]
MLFEINTSAKRLEAVRDTWHLPELDLESYILSAHEDGVPTLNYSVFNEELLIVNNQVRTRDKKRADILAIDRAGNGVVIELKRNRGTLGVDTQALQYLSDFSRLKGELFISKLAKGVSEEDISSFLADGVSIGDINTNNRIILIARGFDATLFSMGEWLSSKGVGFRCISYRPIQVDDRRFISFSISFDQSPQSLYPVEFIAKTRDPKVFWHNIGSNDPEWWSYLQRTDQITTSFDNQPGDQGEKILKGYMAGDRIVAYAKGCGALGYADIKKDPMQTYQLVKAGSRDDVKNGGHLHRIKVAWKACAASPNEGLSPSDVHERFGIYHPVSTSTGIDRQKARALIDEMNMRFR